MASPSSFARCLVSYAKSGPAYFKQFADQVNKYLVSDKETEKQAMHDDGRRHMSLLDALIEKEQMLEAESD